MELRLGFIGLGLMGKSMARNLLKAGFPLTVHNRSQGAVRELVGEGAAAGANPRAVAEASDVLFTSLPDTPDVELVILGPDGVLEGGRPGMIVVDHSTIRPTAAREIAQRLEARGIDFLDAPVSGGDIGARQATLSIMVGGRGEALERVRPALEAMGKTITHVGESGAGQVAKACNQIMAGAQMVALAELLMLARKSGVDPRRVIEAIRGGAAQCWTIDVKAPRLFQGERGPGFKAHMMHKDLAIVLETARTYGAPMPTTAVNQQLYLSMIQQGMGELDNSAVIGVLEELAGAHLMEDSPTG
ncbi:MAG TPA: NAD(P)-binding domain-containing protein [Anaerolineales bacterium]|nr:NAD(P)-binding domain-containing protein [Anaerolineales bacterium]